MVIYAPNYFHLNIASAPKSVIPLERTLRLVPNLQLADPYDLERAGWTTDGNMSLYLPELLNYNPNTGVADWRFAGLVGPNERVDSFCRVWRRPESQGSLYQSSLYIPVPRASSPRLEDTITHSFPEQKWPLSHLKGKPKDKIHFPLPF